LSVITPGLEFELTVGGAEANAILTVPGEEIGLDFGGLDGMIDCINLGSRGEVWPFVDKLSN